MHALILSTYNLGYNRPHTYTQYVFLHLTRSQKWYALRGRNGRFLCGNCHTVFSSYFEIGEKNRLIEIHVTHTVNTDIYVTYIYYMYFKRLSFFSELRTISIRNVMLAGGDGGGGIIKSIWIYEAQVKYCK